MKNITAKARSKRANELYEKALALPKFLIENDQENRYSDKHTPEGEQSKLGKLYDAEQLMLEVRSFVKLSYSKDSEYFDWVHKIFFTPDHKGIITTSLESNNREWQKGKADLISLLANVVSEEKEAIEIEKFIDKTIPLKYFAVTAAFLTSMFAIWTAPSEGLSSIFDPGALVAVRIGLSVAAAALLMIVLEKEKWKELVFTGIIGLAPLITPFLRTDPVRQPARLNMDATQKDEKQPQVALPDTSKLEH